MMGSRKELFLPPRSSPPSVSPSVSLLSTIFSFLYKFIGGKRPGGGERVEKGLAWREVEKLGGGGGNLMNFRIDIYFG